MPASSTTPVNVMDYATVTEATGVPTSKQALSMLYTRYRFANAYCRDKDVLEVACGSGQGLGYLMRQARQVIGGDCTVTLLAEARRHYGRRLPLLQLDAQVLPFQRASFDVVLLYEAIYYISHLDRFLDDCRRVLREKGVLIVCTVNKEWSDFNPSPLSTRYLSAADLEDLFRSHDFRVDLFAAFPAERHSLRAVIVSRIRRTAVALNLIPKTMKGKVWLKRLFFGTLHAVPAEVQDGMAPYCEPVPIASCQPCNEYKIIFAAARPI